MPPPMSHVKKGARSRPAVLMARSPVNIGELPVEALAVEPLLQAARAVDPGAVAVGEGGPVVGLAPDQQPALAVPGRRVLQPVAVGGIVRLAVGAVALVASESGARVGGLHGAPVSSSMTVAAGPGLFGPLSDALAALEPERDA